ncbi:uncharacterized protein BJ171DRAFT_492945 [Polychytrium aggregatum]|uniref:uncharacterized protein n=1 Tax=Polychytrium aggregatum TaxID=110093 RepID=UPI0022FE472B|nr:uncharacterized protein BJ171DRAFT_492945 [Polychytrium aggregatum]KAI9207516.1 hypothetical protein BJ171DRAFT_492945 [Polychytrium aggregatum]
MSICECATVVWVLALSTRLLCSKNNVMREAPDRDTHSWRQADTCRRQSGGPQNSHRNSIAPVGAWPPLLRKH